MMTFSTRPQTRRVLAMAAVLLVAACETTPKVTSDTAPGAKLEAYRTFGFSEAPSTDTPAYTTLTTKYFRDAITREMVARGYALANEPDLLVDFDAAAGTEENTGDGVSMGTSGTSGGMRSSGVGVDLNSIFGAKGIEHVLSVGVVDRQQQLMVWGGSVKQFVSTEQKDYSKTMIDQAVAKIFTKYPKPVVTAAVQGSSQPPPR